MKTALLTPIACLLIGCTAATPPPATPAPATPAPATASTETPTPASPTAPDWNAGGARLRLGPAYWDRGDDERVEIRPNGAVFEGDELVFSVDTQGRVLTSNDLRYVLLVEEGRVHAPGGWEGGRVGLTNATPGQPRQHQAWLSVAPDGSVTFYERDGEREAGGRWHGCDGPMLRTCTLVTHVMLLRAQGGGFNLGNGINGTTLVGLGTIVYFGMIVGAGLAGRGLAAM